MEIVYLRDWTTNIGNTFIHMGGLKCLNNAVPEAKIHVLGGQGRRLLNASATSIYNYLYFVNLLPSFTWNTLRNARRSISEKHYPKIFRETERSIKNFYDMSLGLQADFIVVSGCILTSQLGLFSQTLINHRKKNRKIVLNAVGGVSYSQGEVETVRGFLKELKPYAFISRDRESFENYHGIAEHSYDGIDAAFFINDYFKPPKLQLPEYVVLCFDTQDEPRIDINCDLIIRTSHYTYPPIAGPIVKKIYNRPNLLVSDNPKDYLTLYANAREVHTDRVHACIATLSLGKPCRLYSSTIRGLTFDRMNLKRIRKELTKPDLERIEREKKKQIDFLKQIIT